MMIFSSDLSKFFLHAWFMGFLFESGAVVWKKESLNSEHSSFFQRWLVTFGRIQPDGNKSVGLTYGDSLLCIAENLDSRQNNTRIAD